MGNPETYTPFKTQANYFLEHIVDSLMTGSEIHDTAKTILGEVKEFYFARPSTIASAAIWIAGSAHGIDLTKPITRISTTKWTLLKWVGRLDIDLSESKHEPLTLPITTTITGSNLPEKMV